MMTTKIHLSPILRPEDVACPPDTKLVIGLNKYSHDATLCAADAKTGKVLFAISKERLTRRKHDAGNAASMVEACLDALDLNYDDECIQKVVMNNHHHRILPLERNRKHMEWEMGLGINGGSEEGYDDEYNLFELAEDGQCTELSHHLAHAYSTATQAPFDKGMVVVMDGMGETYRTMLQAKLSNDPSYVSDLSFPSVEGKFPFTCIPSNLSELAQSNPFDFREAESVYVFEKMETTMNLKPVFKRFTPENSPPTLYNHGFENMDSVGALYSRASSHIFGDWNACGKVMGLAPWMHYTWKDFNGKTFTPVELEEPIMGGSLYSELKGQNFRQDKDLIAGAPLISRMDSDLFDSQGNVIPKRRYDFDDNDDDNALETRSSNKERESRLPTKVALEAISLAYRIQIDLENVLMDFVRHCKKTYGEDNLCIAGGVGLNSVLNGKLSRDLGFKQTYISPYPGDDGIAVGCCAYGLFGNAILDKNNDEEATERPPVWKSPLSPYLGPDPTEREIKAAIEDAAPWLEVETVRDENTRIKIVAEEIEIGGVVAWYYGRSELGPRALGHRSILADPRKKGLVRWINQQVKQRESFRPFAPSVLAEYASEWFELETSSDSDDKAEVILPTKDENEKREEPTAITTSTKLLEKKTKTGIPTVPNVSPYMSLTAMVKKEKRKEIPAVTHVDGSSRLQTVTPEAEPLYHKLITKFYDLTGVPMVLNTSFNTLPGEPIVESPKDAIRSFLCSMGSIELLVMGDYVIKRKKANLRSLLGEIDKSGKALVVEPTCPKRTGPCKFETTFEADADEIDEASVVTHTRVRMPKRPMHNDGKGEWFELLDELEGELLSVADGTNSLNDILAQYTAVKKSGEGPLSESREEATQTLVQNVVGRLVRLYENTLISW
ncbi:carbamoyltransferase [Nitzschia inconspicua]|uniref:Carbamoyltransferase n=1 Tax=Nitzschia inconspicua TaxID=303405 RepID=A0A9K3LQC4_9STRA|nr:carbamoyltransferase [Nitzschia inconspicua]